MTPRLLDLFCGAGGCAMGYHRAGFEVTGVDIRPQKRYPFAFHQADALEFLRDHGREYDVIHASPPCQAHSRATAWRGSRASHPDLIGDTRSLLERRGGLWVIENVEDAWRKMALPVMLCGTMFGLRVRRRRLFETPVLIFTPGVCGHRADDYSFDHGGRQSETVYRDAIGCGWMTVKESRQAIPPAFTEYLGRHLLRALEES